MQVVRDLFERDRIAALAEADHEIRRAARDRVADLGRRAIVLDRHHEPHHLRAVQLRDVEVRDGDARYVLVRAVGGKRLEAGDDDLHAGRIAFVRARRRCFAQLQARDFDARVDLHLVDVHAHRQQIRDADVEQRAERRSRPLDEPGVDELLILRGDVHAVGFDLVDLVAARQLEHEPIRICDRARSRRQHQAEALGKHLDVIDIDRRAGRRRDAQRDRRVAVVVERDRPIDPPRVAQPRGRQHLIRDHGLAGADQRDAHDVAARRVRDDRQPHVDDELARLLEAREHVALARRVEPDHAVVRRARARTHHLGCGHARVERMTGGVELAVEKVAQQARIRIDGRLRGARIGRAARELGGQCDGQQPEEGSGNTARQVLGRRCSAHSVQGLERAARMPFVQVDMPHT